jgi:broad specificity phosphatase PhoE
MTGIHLIHAGPTPWDVEDRLVGNHPLPLTDLARATIEGIVQQFAQSARPITAVYRFRKNEACDQAAKLVAAPFKLRPHESAALDELNLGLWQGLTRADLKFRFPKVFQQWQEAPLAVNPPEGEPLADAIDRLGGALKRILRRNRGGNVAIAVRPIAMQIMLGLLGTEPLQTIAGHLHKTSAVETIDMTDEATQQLLR